MLNSNRINLGCAYISESVKQSVADIVRMSETVNKLIRMGWGERTKMRFGQKLVTELTRIEWMWFWQAEYGRQYCHWTSLLCDNPPTTSMRLR